MTSPLASTETADSFLACTATADSPLACAATAEIEQLTFASSSNRQLTFTSSSENVNCRKCGKQQVWFEETPVFVFCFRCQADRITALENTVKNLEQKIELLLKMID